MRKPFRDKICVSCEVSFTPLSANTKYCSSCRTGRPWDVWSLDPRHRLQKLTQMAKSRAKKKSLPFDIDTEYLLSLWKDQQGCCKLTGVKFDLAKWGTKGQVNPDAISVDRISPGLGYTKGNVRLVTYHMNISLSDFGTQEFERLIKNYKGAN